MRRKIKTIILIIVTIIIFFVLFSKIDFLSVMDVISKAKIGFLFLVVLFEVLITLLKAKRWQIIIKSIDYHIPFKESLNLTLAAFPFLTIMPSQSGDMVKGLYLKDRIPVTKTIGTILTEKFFDLLFLILFTLIGLLFFPRLDIIFAIIIISLMLMVVFFIPHIKYKVLIKRFIGEKLFDKIGNLFLSLKILSRKTNYLLRIFNYSFISWLISIIQISFLFYALNIDVPFLFIMANIPIAIFISFIPITLGGMGTRDAAIIYLFSGFATNVQLLGVGILFSLFRYWLVSLVGLFFLRKV